QVQQTQTCLARDGSAAQHRRRPQEKQDITTFSTMKSAALVLSALSAASAFAPSANKASSSALDACLPRETILSEPDTTEIGSIWDPLGLAEMGSDETIAWYRHAEIKHGRVAMAAFVGWWAVGAGVRFPGELAYGVDFASIPSKGLEAWDAVPGWGKAQMLLFAGLIELHDELFFSRRGTHYMKGGTPGKVCLLVPFYVLYYLCYHLTWLP
ncbi:hypothetical protein ACHAWF_003612, partial [Thalassiosira exigua]